MGTLSSRIIRKGLSVDSTGRMVGLEGSDTLSEFWSSAIISVCLSFTPVKAV